MALEEVSTTWLIHFMLLRLVASYLMNTWIQSSPCCNYITHGRHIPHSHKEGDTLEAYPALEKKEHRKGTKIVHTPSKVVSWKTTHTVSSVTGKVPSLEETMWVNTITVLYIKSEKHVTPNFEPPTWDCAWWQNYAVSWWRVNASKHQWFNFTSNILCSFSVILSYNNSMYTRHTSQYTTHWTVVYSTIPTVHT